MAPLQRAQPPAEADAATATAPAAAAVPAAAAATAVTVSGALTCAPVEREAVGMKYLILYLHFIFAHLSRERR